MLHRAEAADLGRDRPGRGFLQVGNNEVFELFQSAHAEGHYRIEGKTHALQQEIEIFEILPTGARKTLSEPAQAQELPTLTRSEAEVFVERLAQAAAKLRLEKLPSPWPEPLHEWYALPEIVGQLQWRGWNGATWESDSRTEHQVRAVLGMLDEPAKQRQVPLIINLAEEDGHLIVVGAPGAGKEMLLRTLIASLACNYTPADVNFFLVEFGGQALRMFQALPHTVGLFLPAEEERLQRLLRRLVKELEARKQICTEAGVESLVKVRALRSDQMPPALVVIITGFAQFWQMYQDQIDLLGHLIREGGANGIHLVIAAERPNEIPLKISGGVFRHLVFRLADAMDYDVELGRYPQSAKEKVPVGRGWFGRPAFEFQAAAPVDARDDSAQTPQLKDIANTMNMAWKGVRPEPVELLRDRIPFKEVLATYSARLGAEAGARPRLVIPIGLDDLRLQPAMVDLNRDGPNFVIAGPSQSGKTTTLITWALSLAELNAPRDVQFLLIGFRRGSLRVLAGLPHVLAHCENSVQFRETVEQLEREIKRRQQSGESSPAIVILIDDYDELVNTAGDDVSLASRLEEVVRKGRNVGLYWVIAGPTELATMYDRLGLIKQVKTGKSGILLRVSDPRESNVLGVWLAAKTGLTGIPPGRGFLVLNGREQLIQVASPEVGKGGRKDIQGWIAEISARSSGSGTSRAVWRAG
jgi:S-DNA-T family DNA segregation ATPase FtsK/SpoIIIE